jgi:hypothetical protein
MPTRRLCPAALPLGLLVALVAMTGVAAAVRYPVAGMDDRVPDQVEQARVSVVVEAAAVLRSGTDRLRTHAAPAGPLLAWLAAAASAAALVVSAVAPDAVAVRSRTTAHVRRRGPPSPV